ncbi:MAG TPA: phosphotransferase, partial [Acidimicrobiales bacterium]|nr:phosphotransferase [Acidimicrobiales bacterium]
DITARNVLGGPDGGPTLIDWEWAGLYPVGYDLVFLWYSLVDVPGARDQVERHVEAHSDVDQPTFLLNALMVQLWHLHWHLPPGFRPQHLATRDHLLTRLASVRP